MDIYKEELYRYHLDSKKSIESYLARKQKKHDQKFPLKSQAISLLLSTGVGGFVIQSFA